MHILQGKDVSRMEDVSKIVRQPLQSLGYMMQSFRCYIDSYRESWHNSALLLRFNTADHEIKNSV